MRPRTLKIVVSLGGMRMPVATVSIKKFADVLEQKTELVCPKCGKKPKWHGGYDCTCCPECGDPLTLITEFREYTEIYMNEPTLA